MSYELAFYKDALKEWRKLDDTVRSQFKKKLQERLVQPHIPAAQLHGHSKRYKIKLHSIGYRLVYEVRDQQLLVLVVAVGKRENNLIYHAAAKRIEP